MEFSPAWITSIVALLGLIAGLWYRLEARFQRESTEREKRVDLIQTKFDEMQGQINRANMDATTRAGLFSREIFDHKLAIADNYVHKDQLRETETRLITAIDKLAAGLDRVLARLDTMVSRLNRSGEN